MRQTTNSKKKEGQNLPHSDKTSPFGENQSKTSPRLPSFSLGTSKKNILRCVIDKLNVHQIERKLNIKRSTIREHLHDLQTMGLVFKDSYFWYPTETAKNYILGGRFLSRGGGREEAKETIRLHDLEFNVFILSKPSNWGSRRNEIFKEKGIEYTPTDLNNNGQELVDLGFNDCKVKVTNNSVLVYPSDIIGEDAGFRALNILFSIIPKVEEKLGIQLVREDGYCKIAVSRQHYAFMNHVLAEGFKKSKDKFVVSDKDSGEVRLLIDFSHRIPEFEAVHYSFSEDDKKRLQNFHSDVIHAREQVLISDLRDMLQDITMQQSKTAEYINLVLQAQLNGQKQFNSLIQLNLGNNIDQEKEKRDSKLPNERPDYCG